MVRDRRRLSLENPTQEAAEQGEPIEFYSRFGDLSLWQEPQGNISLLAPKL